MLPGHGDLSGPFHAHEDYIITFGEFPQTWIWHFDEKMPHHLGPPRSALGVPIAWNAVLMPPHRGRHSAWNAEGTRFVIGEYRDGKMIVGESNTYKTRVLSDMHALT